MGARGGGGGEEGMPHDDGYEVNGDLDDFQ